LPRPGETIHYDINIERFAQNGDIWLFFFNYEATVGGQPLLSMKKGCAGFFTQEELSKGKGVVLTAEETAPAPGKAPAGWTPPAPFASEKETYSEAQLDALRRGRYADCFGPSFAGLPLAPYYPELSDCYLLCVTETKTKTDLDLASCRTCSSFLISSMEMVDIDFTMPRPLQYGHFW